jgi:hypothetical protein
MFILQETEEGKEKQIKKSEDEGDSDDEVSVAMWTSMVTVIGCVHERKTKWKRVMIMRVIMMMSKQKKRK